MSEEEQFSWDSNQSVEEISVTIYLLKNFEMIEINKNTVAKHVILVFYSIQLMIPTVI
jgi:hypothetical protein